MDFMLEEELMDLMVSCLQEPGQKDKTRRIREIGSEIYADGGVDAMENFFFALENRIRGEIDKDASTFRPLWNGLDDSWNY